MGLLQFLLLTKDVTQSHTMQANTGLAVPSVHQVRKLGLKRDSFLKEAEYALHMHQNTPYTFMLKDIVISISERVKRRETLWSASAQKQMPPELPKSSASILPIVLPW